jgi:type IV pilus assembly protein PilC
MMKVKIFKDFKMKLPALTERLMATSNWFAEFWYVLPLFPLGFYLLLKLIRLSKTGNYALDRLYLWLPIIGGLIEKTNVARTMRTLGTLIASGVPILEALAIVRETCTNAVFERMFTRVYESIREGDTISQPLKESRLVDDMVVNMVDVGEETGDLDTMLYKIADVYDEEVDVMVESLISLLEPLMTPQPEPLNDAHKSATHTAPMRPTLEDKPSIPIIRSTRSSGSCFETVQTTVPGWARRIAMTASSWC